PGRPLRFRGVASDAAAVALRGFDVDGALSLLERGRGVLLARRWIPGLILNACVKCVRRWLKVSWLSMRAWSGFQCQPYYGRRHGPTTAACCGAAASCRPH